MWRYLFVSQPKPSKDTYEFKLMHPFDKRKNEASMILAKYPSHIPIIVEKSDQSSVPDIDKHKYIIRKEITLGQFLYILRDRLKLDAVKSLYLYIDNEKVPSCTELMGDIYTINKDRDSFLYVTYSSESSFNK